MKIIKRLLGLGLSYILIHAVFPVSALAGPLGTPVLVNQYTVGSQNIVAVAEAGNGEKVILWKDSDRGGASFIQLYDGNGNAKFNSDFYVGMNASGISADLLGNFAVIYSEHDGSQRDVYVKGFNRDGTVKFNKIKVHPNSTLDQYPGDIAMEDSGNFVVTWSDGTPSNRSIRFQRFNSSGQKLGSSVQVISNAGNLGTSGLDIMDNGVILVGYHSVINNDIDTWVKRYSNNGAALGGAVRVNQYRSGPQLGMGITHDAQDRFLVYWDSYSQDGQGWSSYAQLFNTSGSRVGSPFRLTQTLVSGQPGVRVSMSDSGAFAATWVVDNRFWDSSHIPEIRAREFNANLTPKGNEFVVNPTGEFSEVSWVSMNANGEYSISWRRYDSTNNLDVFTRRYSSIEPNPAYSLPNHVRVSIPAANTDSWVYFKVVIPEGVTSFFVDIEGTQGNADLFLRYGSLPDLLNYHFVTDQPDSTEYLGIGNPPPGEWYIGVYADTAYSNLNLYVNYYF